MKKEILVNVGQLESRVAILEDGRLAELHLEREPRIVGNVYKARVATVLPGMEAAFVDLGLEKHGFLSADDLGHEDHGEGGQGKDDSSETRKRSNPFSDLRSGQEILVQVNRAAIGTKGARVSTRIAIPGRYMVLLMTDAGRVGVSRKIESEKVRQKLKKLGEEICPEGFGLIMRTESEDARKTQLVQDLEMLLELRRRMYDAAANLPAPALVYEDLSLVFQVIRDSFTKDVERLLIDHEGTYHSALEVVGMLSPRLKSRVVPYKEHVGIFERFGVEEEISHLWQRKVWLKAGGYISIDQTEALCAIDVNTARFTGRARTGLADTILRTNLEAAEEIARQLRLRDLGGIIVIDFIDMEVAAHRTRVLKVLEDALGRDRAKTRALSISSLGLVEMTRKKHGESLLEKTSDLCPSCGGLGRVQNPVSISIHIHRELREKAQTAPPGVLAVWVQPRVACMLVGSGGEQIKQLAATLQRPIYVRAKGEDPTEYDIQVIEPSRISERIPTFHAGQEIKCRRISQMDSGIQADIAVSEEGYLVELKIPGKVNLDGEFTVELLDVTASWGIGRVTSVISAPVTEERPAIKGNGINRRGMRRREKREAKKREAAATAQLPTVIEPQPIPVMPVPIIPTPPAAFMPVTEPVVEETEEHKKKRRRRRRRKPGTSGIEGAPVEIPAFEETAIPVLTMDEIPEEEPTVAELVAVEESGEGVSSEEHKKKRRRRRRRHPKHTAEGEIAEGEVIVAESIDIALVPDEAVAEPVEVEAVEAPPAEGETPVRRPRRRRRRHPKAVPAQPESETADVTADIASDDIIAPDETEGAPQPALEPAPALHIIQALPAEPTAEEPKPRRRRTYTRKKKVEEPTPEVAATESAPIEATVIDVPTGLPTEEPKPKRKRTYTRRKKTEEPASE